MSGRENIFDGSISICGSNVIENTIPAETLLRILKALQEITYIVGADVERKSFRERFKPDHDLKEKYELRFGQPKEGSYSIPYAVGRTKDLFSYRALERVDGLFKLITQDNLERNQGFIRDDKYFQKFLHKVLNLLPRPGEDTTVEFHFRDKDPVKLDYSHKRNVSKILTQTYENREIIAVIGEFIKVDFVEKKVMIKYFPTMRELSCHYIDEIEEDLLDSRREPIQVTGRFTLDTEGHPCKLEDVHCIEPVDLSPLFLAHVPFADKKLLFDPPLEIKITLDDETQQLYVAENLELAIHAFATTRDELLEELYEQIASLWDIYVKELCIDKLTDKAISLRKSLSERIVEEDAKK